MPTKIEVEKVEESNYEVWDRFVVSSSQGTIFSTTRWLKILRDIFDREFVIYACLRNGNLVGGCPTFEKRGFGLRVSTIPPFTPYFGILLEKHHSERAQNIIPDNLTTINSIIERLGKDFHYVRMINHPALVDIRAFRWNNWRADIFYTYIVDLRDMKKRWEILDRDARRRIKLAKENGIVFEKSDDLERHWMLHRESYNRKYKEPLIAKDNYCAFFSRVVQDNICRMYHARLNDKVVATAIVALDIRKVYYISCGMEVESKDSNAAIFIVWEMMEHLAEEGYEEFDYVGANTPSIEHFKLNFEPTLAPYYTTEYFSSVVVALLDRMKRLVRRR